MSLTIDQVAAASPSVQAFLETGPKGLFIDGDWTSAAAGRTGDTLDPATGQVLGAFALADVEDVDRAVRAARRAFEAGPWPRTAPHERSALLSRLADLIEQHADTIAQLEVLDNGKPLHLATNGDVANAVAWFRYYSTWPTRIADQPIDVAVREVDVRSVRTPIGVCGLIVPWNAPLLMAAWKLAPALAAGCTTVLKPAEQTPLTALFLADLVAQAGFPPGVVNIVTGLGSEAGSALALHPDVDKIAFTGSTATGRRIVDAAARSNLKKVSCELGGKSPNMIFADAPLEEAAAGAARAIFNNMGQDCTAGSRLFVQRSVYDDVVERVTEHARKLAIGPGLVTNGDLGPVVSEIQRSCVLGYLDTGKAEGATLTLVRLPDDPRLSCGHYVAPAVFTGVDNDMRIAREEIFGPVVVCIPFDDVDDVARLANTSDYGLGAGVWTADPERADAVARRIRSGVVWINDYNLIDPAAPFGGFKQSGWGREHGEEGLNLYLEQKTIWRRPASGSTT